MSNRIYFEAWWRGTRDLVMPAYAMDDGICGREACVASAIARKNGLEVVTLRSDGTALDSKGLPESLHYQTTLGSPCGGGGWTPRAELWFALPVKGRAADVL